ncbi:MAG TPA: NAD(+)/NADH kinase [Syntrophales bacterium]|nr:NAD(+)/NADH kinase [Syntrophales bacterium]HRT71169.1 NAD(+)/NADH kinase [Syntrophales bacterium]
MQIRRIGIIANVEKDKATEYTGQLREWAARRGLEVYLEAKIAAKMGEKERYERHELAARVDMVVVFGGDGTLLMAARSLREYDVPILGVNLGGFGYLTVVNLNEMYAALDLILAGVYRVERRMMLDVVVSRDGKEVSENTVLNDAVINQRTLSRLVDLETFVDGAYLTTYRADGLIVSTPTGSTAYSLSAGGPIVFPQLDSIVINPICPHTLTNRPVILPATATVRIMSWVETEGAMLTYDGQVFFVMEKGDVVTVKKSKYVTNLIASPHRDYMEVLRSKLGWGGSPLGTPNG